MSNHAESRIEESFNPSLFEELEPSQVLREYGVGIDTHSRFIAVCVMIRHAEGFSRIEADYPTSAPGLRQARTFVVSKLEENRIKWEPLRYAIESTGCYHLPVIRVMGGSPSVVNPLLASPTRRKTDRLDARLLAYHSLTNLWPESFLADDTLQQLRVMMLMRRKWKARSVQARNMCNNILLRFGFTIGTQGSLKDRTVRAYVEDLIEDRAVPGALPGAIERSVPPDMRAVLRDCLESYERAERNAKEYERMARLFVESRSWISCDQSVEGERLLALLCSVPGIGAFSAMAWLAEAGNPARFPNAKACAAYCGCDPSLKTSAGKVTSHKRRKGNDELKYILLQAAQRLLASRNEPFGQWGAAIVGRHRKGGWFKAVGAVSRRLANSLYHVHRKLEPFTYEGYELTRSPSQFPLVDVGQMDLGPRAVRVLYALDIRTSRQLLEIYFKGQIPRGIGETTLERIQTWAKQHQRKKASSCEASSSRAGGAP